MNTLVGQYMEHAADALDAAELLQKHGHVAALVNRAYYAVFYCVCALLATEGIATKSHSAARAKFGELFVNTGRFDKADSRVVGYTFAARQSADYDMETVLSDEQATQLLDEARAFYQRSVTYLANLTSLP